MFSSMIGSGQGSGFGVRGRSRSSGCIGCIYSMSYIHDIVFAVIAAYLRVSSKAQDHATQRSAIERVASSRGDVIGRVFSEKMSGKPTARPELDAVRAAARRGEIRKLYVYRLDRLARSGIKDTFEVIEDLRSSCVEVVSVAD